MNIDDEPTRLCVRCGETPTAHIGWEQGHLFQEEAEVQPQEAGATALTPGQEYVVAIWRTDRALIERRGEPLMISWGSWDTPPAPMATYHDAATWEAARTRVMHRYYGPMHVCFWPRRKEEHWRLPPPADAYTLELTGAEPDQE